ncbi:MAG: hypothetical protein WBZ40_07270 [Acidimicrobiia bacterium]
MDGALFAIFVMLAIAILVGAAIRAAQRRDAAQALAASLGLQYAAGDPLDLLSLPHRLFRRGDRRRIDTTLYGDLEGRQVALCDYVYTDTTRDAEGHPHDDDTRLSLCALTLDHSLPWIQISPEGVGRRFLNAISVGNDVQFESDEFNRAFEVLSADRDFAYTLIDPAMIEWLMTTARSLRLEIDGQRLIASTRQMEWEMMAGFADVTLEFNRRMSPLVAEKYGSPK